MKVNRGPRRVCAPRPQVLDPGASWYWQDPGCRWQGFAFYEAQLKRHISLGGYSSVVLAGHSTQMYSGTGYTTPPRFKNHLLADPGIPGKSTGYA